MSEAKVISIGGETDMQRARALAWRDIEGQGTKEERAWLEQPENLPLWRAALVEIVAPMQGGNVSPSMRRTIYEAHSRLATVKALKEISARKETAAYAAAKAAPAPSPGATEPGVDVNGRLTQVIEMLSGLDDLKAAAVRERCTVARRALIELRQAHERQKNRG
jgi:hypothetical protein